MAAPNQGLCDLLHQGDPTKPPWRHGLCGCFDNFGLCVTAFFLPCYVFGKNAEYADENCCVCGLAYCIPCLNLVALIYVRRKLSKSDVVDGDSHRVVDCFAHLCCHFCALVQEAQEVEDARFLAAHPQHMARS